MNIRRKLIWFAKLVGRSILSFLRIRSPKKDRGLASGWGNLEHHSGRYTGLAILLSLVLAYFKNGRKIDIVCCFIALSFIIWLVYLVSHHLEKGFFKRGNDGKGGLRASTLAGR